MIKRWRWPPAWRCGVLRFFGTTMLVLVFTSASEGASLARHGDVLMPQHLGLTIGLAPGAYIGARFTRRAPRRLLRSAVITIPFVAGAMLLFL
jgi:uncharacterized membrane protein YfcA